MKRIIITLILFVFAGCVIQNNELPIQDEYFIARYKKEGKYGLMNKTGQEIIQPLYNWLVGPTDSTYVASKENQEGEVKWGYLNIYGEEIIPFKYDQTGYFINGIAPVKVNNKWGFINKQGEYTIEPIFDDARWFTSGRARVKIGNTYGHIDYKGTMVIEAKYEASSIFWDSLCHVTDKNQKKYLIDVFGTHFMDTSYTIHHNFNNSDFTKVSKYNDHKKKHLFGLINKNAEIVIPLEYDDIKSSMNDMIAVAGKENSYGEIKYGYINQNNEELIEFDFELLNSFNRGVGVAGKLTQIDTVKMNLEMKQILLRSGKGKYGGFNNNGENIIPFDYTELYVVMPRTWDSLHTDKTFLIGKMEGKFGVIDSINNIIIPFEFDEILYSTYNLFNCKKDNSFYLIDSMGEVKFKSEDVQILNGIKEMENYFYCREVKSNKIGIMDFNGNWKVKPMYELIDKFYKTNFITENEES